MTIEKVRNIVIEWFYEHSCEEFSVSTEEVDTLLRDLGIIK